jgi:hypothetical protein
MISKRHFFCLGLALAALIHLFVTATVVTATEVNATQATATVATATEGTATVPPVPIEAGSIEALPASQDQPEEVLRTEIILDARSPINGKPITAAEYAELEARIDERNREIGVVPPRFRQLITLLRIRKVLRAIFPFIP